MNGRLYRSRDDRMVAGVAGGVAAFVNIDPSLVRILWVVLIPLTGGLILLLYLAMALIVPEQRFDDDRWRAWEAQSGGTWTPPPVEATSPSDDPWPSTGAFGSDSGPIPSAGEPALDAAAPLAGFAAAASSDAATSAGAATSPLASFDLPTTADAATSAFEPTATGVPSAAGSPAASPAFADTRPSGSGPTWSAPPPGPRPQWSPPPERRHDRTAPLVFGLILVFIGGVLLARTYLPGIDWGLTWPILFVGIGIALVVGSVRRSSRR